MQVPKVQNTNNLQFKGLWEVSGKHTVNNELGVTHVQEVKYHAFKDEGQDAIANAHKKGTSFHFLSFDENKTPHYQAREVKNISKLPFTEEEYNAFMQTSDLKDSRWSPIKRAITEHNLQESIEVRPSNVIQLGGRYGNLILDEKAKGYVSPLEQDLIDISKKHKLSIFSLKENRSILGVGVMEQPIKSRNPIINLFNRLIGKKHPSVLKEVSLYKFDENTGTCLYESAKTVRENVIKAFKQAAAESESQIRNIKLDKLLRR